MRKGGEEGALQRCLSVGAGIMGCSLEREFRSFRLPSPNTEFAHCPLYRIELNNGFWLEGIIPISAL